MAGNRLSHSQVDYYEVEKVIDEIESEMKRIGFWKKKPLSPEKYRFQRAFGGDTMAFEQWIQFILIPNVRRIIEEKGRFPKNSQVAVYAVKELDGNPYVAKLQGLLRDFDNLF